MMVNRQLRPACTLVLAGLLTAAASPAPPEEAGSARLIPVPIQQVRLEDDFWAPRLKVWREVTIPDALGKFEKDGALTNFDKVRDGLSGGHGGPPWYDGLTYEMIRGAADFLVAQPDPKLEARLDGYIERIAAAAARDPNGYLNTYTQLEEPDHRWGLNGGNVRWQHDLYNAGAMVEAAVHYYRATGKTQLLDAATKLANHMADRMGPSPRQNIIPGHALGEESLVSLHQLFKEQPQLKSQLSVPVEEQRYLDLAEFWVDARGHHEGRTNQGAYNQDHVPVVQQETIEGHAVRAVLLCSGLVAVGEAAERPEYLAAARRLWENMVSRRMYVTGGVGAEHQDEKFGPDYHLPNTGYAETCASVAAAFFHHDMSLAFADARYADELERVLYNGLLCGVSLTGDAWFYENPLEAGTERTRWTWHPCPCCPPMFLKIMGALPGCIYAQSPEALFVNLFIGSRAAFTVSGAKVAIRQSTQYPWDGTVKLTIEPEQPATFAVNLRLPGWCESPQVRLNGRLLTRVETVKGYASLQREWSRGDVVELSLPMPVRRLEAHPNVEAARGRVALQRGPLVYCLEAVDNGGHVRNRVLPPASKLTARHRPDLLGGVTVIEGSALAVHRQPWPDPLYLPSGNVPGITNTVLTAIPYYANANRQPGEMQVWMAGSSSLADPLPLSTVASRARATASHCWQNDSVSALNDQIELVRSDDTNVPRFTWWDRRGTAEWVQYDFAHPEEVSAIEVYWWDERRIAAHCRLPRSWRLLYQADAEWKPVSGGTPAAAEMDRFNRLEFAPVQTTALRLEVQLESGWSGGILEWRVE